MKYLITTLAIIWFLWILWLIYAFIYELKIYKEKGYSTNIGILSRIAGKIYYLKK
jgi:hypothetical protein